MFLWKSRRNHCSHVSAPSLHIPALLMTLLRSMMQGNNVRNYGNHGTMDVEPFYHFQWRDGADNNMLTVYYITNRV